MSIQAQFHKARRKKASESHCFLFPSPVPYGLPPSNYCAAHFSTGPGGSLSLFSVFDINSFNSRPISLSSMSINHYLFFPLSPFYSLQPSATYLFLNHSERMHCFAFMAKCKTSFSYLISSHYKLRYLLHT